MMIYRFTIFFLGVLVRSLFHFQAYGRNNLDKVKGAILAVNHSSYADPVFASVAVWKPMYFLARKSLFRNKYFGGFLRVNNCIPFNRDAPDTKTLKCIIGLLKAGKKVLIFPEGTRSPDGNLLPGHAGIGFIAIKAGVPIIPSYISGAHKILPRNSNIVNIAKTKMIIGEPIYIDKWINKQITERSDYQEIADLVMEKIGILAGK